MTREQRESIRHWAPTAVGILSTIVILVIGSVFLYAAFWPVPTFRVDSIRTTQSTYVAGADITYVVKGCKFTDLPTDIDLQLEGVGATHDEYPIPTFTVTVRAGCGVGVNHLTLPSRMTAGTYVLRDSQTYHLNKLHDELVTGVSNPFTVTAAPST